MQPDLIYDVGLHDGVDTGHYLDKGYRVVAIDANPLMVERAATRFAREVEDGRLTLLNVGVHVVRGEIEFHVSDHDEWSSFDEQAASRLDVRSRPVTVPTRPFAEVLAEHGSPFYLKVDIEQLDHLCLLALREVPAVERPRYVSWEAGFATVRDLHDMRELGYDSFKFVRQNDHKARFPRLFYPERMRVRNGLARRLHLPPPAFPFGSSGPFGEATDGDWHSYDRAAQLWLRYLRRAVKDDFSGWRVWFDVHARRSGPA